MRTRLVHAFYILVIVGLGCLTSVIYREWQKTYAEMLAVRLDPAAIGMPTAPNPVGQGPLVLIVGDSRAALWGIPSIPGYRFLNLGVVGQTTAQTLLPLEAQLSRYRPSTIVVQVGINDLKAIPVLREKQNLIETNCFLHIQEIVEKGRARGAAVILTTIMPTGTPPIWRRGVWSSDILIARLRINEKLKSLSAPTFDTEPILADAAGNLKGKYQADFMHLNAAGYSALEPQLARLLLRGLR